MKLKLILLFFIFHFSLFTYSLPPLGSVGESFFVSNPTSLQRQELVEVSLASLNLSADKPFQLKNAIGQQVDYQITYDGKLLFDASVMPNSTAEFTIHEGTPRPPRRWVEGRLYPDRVDDVAWENDRCAYRVYGKAFRESGAIGYGPDVWVKNTPELVVNQRFRMDIDIKPRLKELEDAGRKEEAALLLQDNSFHVDHGNGNDGYAVGATLGCGAPAILVSSSGYKMIPTNGWETYRILDNGPLRFTVEFTFLPDSLGLQEHRIMSLDKGSNFNRIEVWYESINTSPRGGWEGASGFPLHSPNEHTLVIGKDYMQYADPTDNPAANNYELYIACLYPYDKVKIKKMLGHALALRKLKVGEHWIYYAGSAWSKHDVRNQLEWQCRINTTLNALKNPLTVCIK